MQPEIDVGAAGRLEEGSAEGGMNGKLCILIGFTPYHVIPLTEIINLISEDIYIFHPDPSIFEKKGSRKGNIHFLSKGRSKFTDYYAAARKIKRLMTSGQNVSVYVPHPYNPLANYAFFSPSVAKRNIYQDGILNYYDANINWSLWKRVKRWLFAASVGLSFRFFNGHLSGVDEVSVDGGYFTCPQSVVKKAAFKHLYQLPSRSTCFTREIAHEPDAFTLFLDQPIEKACSRDKSADMRDAAVRLAQSIGMPVVYKPHHEQGSVVSKQSDWLLLGPEQLGKPAELLVESMNVTNVVGFYSSALINVKVRMGNIDCYAVGAEQVPIMVDGKRSNLSQLMAIFGVRCISIDSHVSSAGQGI